MNRVLLLSSPRSYRVESFVAAAKKLGIDLTLGIDMPATLTPKTTSKKQLYLDFTKPEQSIQKISEFATQHPIDAVLPVDDSGTLLSAWASNALGLRFNDPSSAKAAHNKLQMRRLLHERGVLCPDYRQIPFATEPEELADEIDYPCVVKPLQLSGSRGVIRANSTKEFVPAFHQTRQIAQEQSPHAPPFLLVEQFIAGIEVAVEGLLYDGELHILAIFDKPDPLDGPYFEETIYVTPSRLPAKSPTTDHRLYSASDRGFRLETWTHPCRTTTQ